MRQSKLRTGIKAELAEISMSLSFASRARRVAGTDWGGVGVGAHPAGPHRLRLADQGSERRAAAQKAPVNTSLQLCNWGGGGKTGAAQFQRTPSKIHQLVVHVSMIT